VGEEGGFSAFFLCSQHIPFKFPRFPMWEREVFILFFPLFLTCFLQVPNMFPRFPMCSPRVLPIAPRFNPLYFAQSPPLLTYIGEPKGEALHLSMESSILGSLHSFYFLLVMGQSNWLIAKKRKRLDLWGTPTY
jgi:hypothetical protein